MRSSYLLATLLLAACAPNGEAHHDLWLNPSKSGTWAPDATMLDHMKVLLSAELDSRLDKTANHSGSSVRYWFQFRALGSGEERALAIVGGPFPVPGDADMTYPRPYIPEVCHITSTYLLNAQQVNNLVIGGFCPPRI